MTRSGFLTIGIMVAVIAAALLYILLRDQSVLQKHNSTPAASALLPDNETDSFRSLDGQPISLASDFGSVIVVSTWASWCVTCASDFPKLEQIANEFKEKGVVVYAVNRGEDMYSAERYLATITKPASVTFLIDQNDYFFSNSGGYAMPETTVYTKKGDIALQQRGELRIDELRGSLQALTE